MAGRYLPTELQNSDGDVIYPHTEADVVFMSDGENVEEVLKRKGKIVFSRENIPVAQREAGALYIFTEGAGTRISAVNIASVDPLLGYKVIQ